MSRLLLKERPAYRSLASAPPRLAAPSNRSSQTLVTTPWLARGLRRPKPLSRSFFLARTTWSGYRSYAEREIVVFYINHLDPLASLSWATKLPPAISSRRLKFVNSLRAVFWLGRGRITAPRNRARLVQLLSPARNRKPALRGAGRRQLLAPPVLRRLFPSRMTCEMIFALHLKVGHN